MTTTQRIEITEGRPLSYTAHDGTVIVVSVAGPVDKIYTLTVNGERVMIDRDEDKVRWLAREAAEMHNARWAEAMKAAAGTSVLIDDIAPLPACNCQPHPIFGHEDACRYVGTGPVVAQIASPLPATERQSSGLAGPSGSAANAMSAPVRDMLAEADRHPHGSVFRGTGRRFHYPIGMLKAAARRGWLALDDKIRPTCGRLTDAGRKALARELASTGGAR